MMNVFEKIREKLEELCEQTYYNSVNGNRYEGIRNNAYHNAIEIVNQVEKEHNNGWIPCSERLPEEAFGCLVTVMDCEPSTQTDFENILPYFVGYDGHSWNDADGEEIPFEVIEWKRIPEPYKERD